MGENKSGNFEKCKICVLRIPKTSSEVGKSIWMEAIEDIGICCGIRCFLQYNSGAEDLWFLPEKIKEKKNYARVLSLVLFYQNQFSNFLLLELQGCSCYFSAGKSAELLCKLAVLEQIIQVSFQESRIPAFEECISNGNFLWPIVLIRRETILFAN